MRNNCQQPTCDSASGIVLTNETHVTGDEVAWVFVFESAYIAKYFVALRFAWVIYAK